MNRPSPPLMRSLGILCGLILCMFLPLYAQELNENCVVSALNRTAPVQSDGVWVLPNTPSNLGRIRLRATCVENGVVRSGTSDPIEVPTNGVIQVSEIRFDNPAPIPERVELRGVTVEFTAVGQKVPLTATARFPDGSTLAGKTPFELTLNTTTARDVCIQPTDTILRVRFKGDNRSDDTAAGEGGTGNLFALEMDAHIFSLLHAP